MKQAVLNQTLRHLAEQYAVAARQVLGDRITSIVLFGSVARGQAASGSDILSWAGLEVPWLHDVGLFLRQHVDRFPAGFGLQIPRLASISRSLGVERERSFYGDEESGLPPETLYSDQDAAEALEKATFVLDTCRHLLEETQQRMSK